MLESFDRTNCNKPADFSERTDLIKLLIEKKVNLNPQMIPNKKTPLHMAVENKSTEIVKILVLNGANCKLTNHEGRTALQEAEFLPYNFKNQEIFTIIKEGEITSPIYKIKNTDTDEFLECAENIYKTFQLLNKYITLPEHQKELIDYNQIEFVCICALQKILKDSGEEELLCLIGFCGSDDFVMTPDAKLFDREMIEHSLKLDNRSPTTRQPLKTSELVTIPKHLYPPDTALDIWEANATKKEEYITRFDACYTTAQLLRDYPNLKDEQKAQTDKDKLVYLCFSAICDQIKKKGDALLSCEISLDVSKEFVIAPDGRIYDKATILESLKIKNTSPFNEDLVMSEEELIPIPEEVLDMLEDKRLYKSCEIIELIWEIQDAEMETFIQQPDAIYKVAFLISKKDSLPKKLKSKVDTKKLLNLGYSAILHKMKIENQEKLTCPILKNPSSDMVVAPDGNIYDKDILTVYLENHDISPMDKKPMKATDLAPIPTPILKKLASKGLYEDPSINELEARYQVQECIIS